VTRALAIELAPIRVNIVAPGMVKTPLWANVPEGQRESMYWQAAGRLPVSHLGEADEVAQAYLYLMEQTYITGKR
jgi:NAD(P)-dependent dehydrogenase (short-subunit alcohol dehydrogenase family)